jgi:hypothetical protein
MWRTMQVAKNMWQQCALVAVVIEKVQGSFLCKSFFFVSIEEENLFFQKSSGPIPRRFLDLGLGMGLGCVEKCRKMSKKVDCF